MLKRLVAIFLILITSSSITLAEKIIKLPNPETKGQMSLEETIAKRRSERKFTSQELTQKQISQILWAAQGITDQSFGFRAAPSAGALYPVKLYLIKKDGVFRYIPDGHKLLEISDTDLRPSLQRASLGQRFIRQAPASLVIAGNFAISQAKYGPRAFRYVCMEIGHIAENIQLQAVSLGLSSVVVGAFWDDVIKKVLKVPENEEPLYIIPIGYKE